MARPVQVRPTYGDDAAFLLRLEDAVRKDERQTDEWKFAGAKLLRDTARHLLSANLDPSKVSATTKKAETSSKK